MTTMESFTLPLDNTTGKSMSLYLYTNVCNTRDIREKLISGEIPCCVIKASLVTDPFHVAVAANKAALRAHRSKLTTKTIYTEILFAMSTSGKITDSLAKFGIHDDDKNIIVVLIHEENKKKELEDQVLKHIDGVAVSISRIKEFTDESRVKKIYKIDDKELSVSGLLYSVVSRISGDSSGSLK